MKILSGFLALILAMTNSAQWWRVPDVGDGYSFETRARGGRGIVRLTAQRSGKERIMRWIGRLSVTVMVSALALQARAAVDFNEAAAVAIKATQLARITPAGITVQTCLDETALQQKFADDPAHLPLAREMMALRTPIMDVTYRALSEVEATLAREPRNLTLSRPAFQAVYTAEMRYRLAPLAGLLVQAVRGADLQPAEDLLALAEMAGGYTPSATCTKLPCCDTACVGCCSKTRCDGGTVGCTDRHCSCKASPAIVGGDCTPPPVACDVNEPLQKSASSGATR